MIETFKVDAVNSVLEAINNPVRYKLVKLLQQAKGSVNITELSNQLGYTLANVGIHLTKLEKVGLIKNTKGRDQRNNYYEVNSLKVNKVINAANEDFYIFYKAYLLTNKTISRILTAINTQSMNLVELDKEAEVSAVHNTGLVYTYLKKLVEAGLVKQYKENGKILYRTNGSELIKTVKTLKSI